MRAARLSFAVAVALSSSLAFSSSACRRAPKAAATPARGAPPRGDAVWFRDPMSLGDVGVEAALARLSAAAVFVAAGTVDTPGGRAAFAPDPPPPPRQGTPQSAAPVVLVVRAGPALAGALATEKGIDPDDLAGILGGSLTASLAEGGPYGRVGGVHLDFPFTAASAKAAAAFLDAFRPRLSGAFLSIAAAVPAGGDGNEEMREAWMGLAHHADALVAPAFGFGAGADLAVVDGLGRPWWAAFSAAAHGTLAPADGGPAREVGEAWLDPLSGNPRVEFENDLSVPDASFAAFHLTAHAPIRQEGLSLSNGDRVTYRVPALTEMLFQLGSALAGKRQALGRILILDGPVDSGRLFRLAAFEDVILGRSLAPTLDAKVIPAGRGAIGVELTNRSAHASIPSRMSNWVEVDVAPAHPADVTLGGFDRYATYDKNGQPVTPGRATRVRLFETLLSPEESVVAARIVLRGGVPARCCRLRTHIIAASGSEEETDWVEPPVPPTPTKAPAASRKAPARLRTTKP